MGQRDPIFYSRGRLALGYVPHKRHFRKEKDWCIAKSRHPSIPIDSVIPAILTWGTDCNKKTAGKMQGVQQIIVLTPFRTKKIY
jgi:hypothetical protein